MGRDDNSVLSSAPAAARLARPLELEDILNRFIYHPAAARLARILRPTPVSPNAVSVAGAVSVWAAAWAYTGIDRPWGVVAGFSLHALWHVLDGADGDLARLTGRSSNIGEIVDGLCDYAAHIILYVLLAAFLARSIGAAAWPVAALAGASRMVQMNHVESQRRNYLWWAHGVPWLRQSAKSSQSMLHRNGWFRLLFGRLVRTYLAVATAMGPKAEAVDSQVLAAWGRPEALRRVQAQVRAAFAPALRLQKLEGANPRTVLLAISMALGTPLWFFLLEILALNLLLVASVRYHNRLVASLARSLAAIAGSDQARSPAAAEAR